MTGTLLTARHTPGLWSVLDNHGVHVLAEGGLTIATVAHQLDCARVEGRVQLQNARLIAAAPELLEALTAFVRNPGLTETERQHLAIAAFTKATGEAP